MPSLVQAPSRNQQFTVNSIAKSFASLPAKGNFIVVKVAAHAAANFIRAGQITDNQGNTYQVGVICDPSGISPSCAIFYAVNIGQPSGIFTVTYTPLSNCNCWIMIEEWSGMGSEVISATHAANYSSSTTPNTGTTGSVTPPATGSLVCAVSSIIAANTSYVVDSVSPAWTQIDEQLGVGGSNVFAPPGESDSRVITASGTQSCGWTSDVAGGASAGIVVFASNIRKRFWGWNAGGGSLTVNADKAVAWCLDGLTHVFSEVGKFKIFGDFEVTGTTTFSGPVAPTGDISGLTNRIITTDDGVNVLDGNGNIVFTS